MFEKSISYPWNDGDGVKTIIIGGVLTLLGFLVIPLVLVSGYSLRVIRAVVDGDSELPAWDDLGGLFVDGFRALVVTVAYFAVPAVLLFVAVAAFFVPLSSPPRVATLVFAALALVALPLVLVAWYVLPAALVRVAVTRRVGPAFAVRRLWPVLSSGTYVTAWLLGLGILVAAGALTGVLGATGIGAVLGGFVTFYASLSATYLYARGVADAVPVATETDGTLGESLARY